MKMTMYGDSKERETCKHCGRIYEVGFCSLPARDKDEFYCECGELFKRWNGAGFYTFELIEEES